MTAGPAFNLARSPFAFVSELSLGVQSTPNAGHALQSAFSRCYNAGGDLSNKLGGGRMMGPAPRVIGGAKVICFTSIDERHRPTGNCKQIVAGVLQGPATGLA